MKSKGNEIIKDFIVFLKRKDVYMSFIKNVMKDNQMLREKSMEVKSFLLGYWEYFGLVATGCLMCSFLWENSEQGYEFWSKLDKEWVHYGHLYKLF